jgi:glycosyltransferase involved in cell wall biosynthesis
MRILHHERKRLDGHFSLERLFAAVRAHLPPGLEVKAVACPFPSRGLFPRLGNVLHASRQRADVHHVVGDVHYLVLGLPSRRTVLTIHDTAALDRLRGIRRAVLRQFWFVAPMRRAAMVTIISEASRAELRRHVGPLADRARVIPDCVPTNFRFTPRQFDTDQPVCLQVGTKWNKNLGRTASALRGTPCRLDVVGRLDDEQRAELAAAGVPWRELGVPDDDAMRGAYERCDFVLFASLYEGFGMPVLEAQATGRPVITSNRGPMPEAAGGAALLVDPLDVQEMGSAVRRLISDADLRGRLVARGVENVARFHPSVVAARYAEVYREVFSQDSP